MPDWKPVHVGWEKDGFSIGGLDVWDERLWRRTGETVMLRPPHRPEWGPTRFGICEAGEGGNHVRVAIAEVQFGLYAFYVFE